jgi:hypothetical protein
MSSEQWNRNQQKTFHQPFGWFAEAVFIVHEKSPRLNIWMGQITIWPWSLGTNNLWTSATHRHIQWRILEDMFKADKPYQFLKDSDDGVLVLNELCFWTLSIVWCLKNKQKWGIKNYRQKITIHTSTNKSHKTMDKVQKHNSFNMYQFWLLV